MPHRRWLAVSDWSGPEDAKRDLHHWHAPRPSTRAPAARIAALRQRPTSATPALATISDLANFRMVAKIALQFQTGLPADCQHGAMGEAASGHGAIV